MKKISTWLAVAAITALSAPVAHAFNENPAKAPKLQVNGGSVKTMPNFKSEYVTARNVHVWLPDGYAKAAAKGEKFAVLYMHDGQMLFDAKTTWNKQEWGIDEVATKLQASNKVRPFIVVGVDNGGPNHRHSDYFPQKPFENLTDKQLKTMQKKTHSETNHLYSKKVNSDDYLKFLVTEVKPFIDRNYAVLTEKDSTFVMGSSMGGLISMYAISEYPSVFGGAACLSTHWPGVMPHEGNPVPAKFFDYMGANLPSPNNHKIYFDYGDQTLDAYYPPHQKQADKVMKAKGFTDKNWQTLFFKGQDHSEVAWNSRLDKPILFLLGK